MITAKQTTLARHALGLNDARHKQSYRNWYVTNAPHPEWEDLVTKGYAYREIEHGDSAQWIFYKMTSRGARAVLKKGETLDKEDFPDEFRLRYDWYHGHRRWRLFYNDQPMVTFPPARDLAFALDWLAGRRSHSSVIEMNQ